MSFKSLFSCPWHGLLLACCFFIAPIWTARAQDLSLASDLTIQNSVIDLHPLAPDNPASKSSSAPATSADSLASAGPPGRESRSRRRRSGAWIALLPVCRPRRNCREHSRPARRAIASASVGASAPTTPTQNVTINLINLMVKRNLISREDAEGLIRQAQQEADTAKAQAAATQAAAERALTAQSAQPAPAPATAPAPGSDDEVRIAYVPDVVKKQITDQVTQNVMEQTREEHLADTIAASSVPDWVKRFHVNGDIRVRYEGDDYPSGNAVGNFTNFNAINTSASGFNVNTSTPPCRNMTSTRTATASACGPGSGRGYRPRREFHFGPAHRDGLG